MGKAALDAAAYFYCPRMKGSLMYRTCVRRQKANDNVRTSSWTTHHLMVAHDICMGCMRGASIRKRLDGQVRPAQYKTYQSNYKGHVEGVKEFNRRKALNLMREKNLRRLKEIEL